MLKAVVLAAAGPFRQELLSFLRAIPDLELTAVVEDPAGIGQAVARAVPHCLILQGGAPFTTLLATLAQLKRASPYLPCLILVENCQQIQQAFAAGADSVLLKGFSTQEFLSALLRITSESPKITVEV